MKLKTNRVVGIIAIAVFIIILISLGWHFNHRLSSKTFQDAVKEAKERTYVPNGAVVFLALGAQANQLNCPAAIESLVRYAGWGGDVYLLSDRTECFDRSDIIKNAGMKYSKFHMKKVHGQFSGGIDLFGKLGSRKMRVKSLSMKNKLFDYIDNKNIDTAVFADCDILFGQPQCVEQLIRENDDWTNQSMRFSHTAHSPSGRLIGIHAGMFLAHRSHSSPALEGWSDQFQLGIHEHDRDAYIAAYEKTQLEVENRLRKENGQTMLTTLPLRTVNGSNEESSIHWYLNPLNANELRRQSGPRQGEPFENFYHPDNPIYCMNHISKARCSAIGRNKVQNYVDRFHLRTYENSYSYCTHESIASLQYGWFPLQMVPFCPKLEKFM